MSASTSLVERCLTLDAELVSRWGDEFAERLLGDPEAALGFAIARSIQQGWATPASEIEVIVCAAEDFLSALVAEEG